MGWLGRGFEFDGAFGGKKAGLPASKPLTASGPGITAVLGGDGMYTITTTASSAPGSTFAGTADDVFAGDYLAEVEIVSPANGLFGGFDNAAPATRGATSIDECLVPDQGFGPGEISLQKNGTDNFSVFTGPRLYLERVGTTLKLYQGASWDAAKITTALVSTTAVDGTARSFQFGCNVGALVGQWKVRAIDHP
jgi:hypothetical protein